MTRFRYHMLSFLICTGISLLAACVIAGGNDVAGEWDWVDGQRLMLRPNQTLEVFKGRERVNEGTWECVDPYNQRYVFRHRNGGWVDSVTLSQDGRSLDGSNQQGYALHGSRISGGSGYAGGSGSGRSGGNCGAVAGEWNWVDGQILVVRPNQTVEVFSNGERINEGTWECVDQTNQRYVFRHRNGGWVDSVTLSPDGRSLDGKNQQGYALHGSRISGGTGFSGGTGQGRGDRRHPDRISGKKGMGGNSGMMMGGAVVGEWNWVDGQTLVLRPNQTLEVFKNGERINDGTWECVDQSAQRYVFRHRNGGWVDSVILSPDGTTLDGQNQRGYALHGTRTQRRQEPQPQQRLPQSRRPSQ